MLRLNQFSFIAISAFLLLSNTVALADSNYVKKCENDSNKHSERHFSRGIKATQAALDAEIAIRVGVEDALQSRTVELCTLYQKLFDMSLIGELTVPEVCPAPPVCDDADCLADAGL